MDLLDFFKRKKTNDDEDIDIDDDGPRTKVTDDDTDLVGMEDNPDDAILAAELTVEFDETLPPEMDANPE
ncbi:MAG: hypothetical protein OSA23_13525, partial [Rhodospirillales bacterium]|nr:hypothetical protein [Rhodospirillales bacterium]